MTRIPWFVLLCSLLVACGGGGGGRTAVGYDSDRDGWENKLDCEPMNELVHPGAEELCGDARDNDCDGVPDENCLLPRPSFEADYCGTDTDEDTFCWHHGSCGMNAEHEIVCWGPHIYSHATYRTVRPRVAWRFYPCAVTGKAELECYGPVVLGEDGTAYPPIPRATLEPLGLLPLGAGAAPDETG